jgi:hypothetical protein
MVDLLLSVILHQLLSVPHQFLSVILPQLCSALLRRDTEVSFSHRTAMVLLKWVNGAHIWVLGVLSLVLLSMASALLDLVTMPLRLHLLFQSVSVKAMTLSDIIVGTVGERIAIGAMRVERTGGSTGVADAT